MHLKNLSPELAVGSSGVSSIEAPVDKYPSNISASEITAKAASVQIAIKIFMFLSRC